ncbi:MAG: fucose isomerase [candidate division KSB1 bacterium]|nr:fucose isomerase [candidate division KSB1 bacterium]
MKNIPEVKLGLVAVSRDCFPIELSRKRRKAVLKACEDKIEVTEIETIIESEADVPAALKEINEKNVNALAVYLGNFGPEGPTTLLIQKFDGPAMLAAAAEESQNDLIQGRGDAYCGMLNASYSTGLRSLNPYIPEYPVGDAQTVADMMNDFLPVARIVLGLAKLKVFSFGPRPQDFLACNAPIKPLFDLGIEIMENSELDLYDIVQEAKGDSQIKAIASDMSKELGTGNNYPDLIEKLAQYEVALRKFMHDNLGVSSYAVFANKCWPAFEKYFGHVPCFINGRLAREGIPVACEVDIYGALSEYMVICATQNPPAILDINNSVPADMYEANQKAMKDYKLSDLFMGFHCGNASSSCMKDPEMKYQLIMNRLMEDGSQPDITRGTLEGQLLPGDATIFRLQSTASTALKSYVAQGEILDIDPQSFGSIGVFAIPEMGRFYRHVLIEKRFPHHTAVAFGHAGQALFAAVKMMGVQDVSFNLPASVYYPTENPFG